MYFTLISRLTPEKEGALQAIRHLKQQNVRVMLGHSAATWQQTRAAFDAGADGLVHCYNGMTGLHHNSESNSESTAPTS